MLNYNKKAQIGQTIFWVLVTLIIVVVMIFFIVASVSLSAVKELKLFLNSNLDSGLKEESQILLKKTIIAYELNDANKQQIEEILKQK